MFKVLANEQMFTKISGPGRVRMFKWPSNEHTVEPVHPNDRYNTCTSV